MRMEFVQELNPVIILAKTRRYVSMGFGTNKTSLRINFRWGIKNTLSFEHFIMRKCMKPEEIDNRTRNTERSHNNSTLDSSMGRRVKVYALGILLVLHALNTLFVVFPGYLSVDEMIYHMMTRDFVRHGALQIFTGYEDFSSPELTHQFIRVFEGRLYPPYPSGIAVLAAPFYSVSGYFGLFLLNALIFPLVGVLTYAIGRRLTDDADIGLNACLILVAATFIWEYSQAAWPHMSATLFIVAAFACAAVAYTTEHRSRALVFAVGAGLACGIGPALRIDAVLAIPCIAAIFLFARPIRVRETLGFAAGLVPGLLLLSLSNQIKFGVSNPIAYGPANDPYVPPFPTLLASIGTGAVVVLWVLSRSRTTEFMRERFGTNWWKYLVVGAVAAAVIIVMLNPPLRHATYRMLGNGYAGLVDIRAVNEGLHMPGAARTPSGAVVYAGALKKALLQSLPYLAVFVLPLAAVIRGAKETDRLLILALFPSVVFAYFFYDHVIYGGLCLNGRYYVPTLPFVAILCAYGVREIQRYLSRRTQFFLAGLAVCLTVVLYYFLVTTRGGNVDALEFPLLDLPLILAALLFISLMIFTAAPGGNLRSRVAPIAWSLFIAGLTWAAITAYAYDYQHHYRIRAGNFWISESVLSKLPERGLFFTKNYSGPALVEKEDMWIAFPSEDGFKDFPRLVDRALESDRRVFAGFPLRLWKNLAAGPLKGYRIEKIWEFTGGSFVGEIKKPSSE